MSTLKYMGVTHCSTEEPHHIYNTPSTDPMMVMEAAVKCKVLVQRYPLTDSHYAGKKRCKECPLCSEGPEDLEHFLHECKITHHATDTFLEKMQAVMSGQGYRYPPFSQSSKEWYTQLMLDAKVITQDPNVYTPLESISRRMIFKLHHRRAISMGGSSGYSWARARVAK